MQSTQASALRLGSHRARPSISPSLPTLPSPCRSHQSQRLPHPHAIPIDAPAVATALVLGLPASVLLDELLDTAAPRVNTLTNVEANGVRMFVARPNSSETQPPQQQHPSGTDGGSDAAGTIIASQPPAATRPVRLRAVILIHQILGLQRREVDLAAALAAEEGVVAVAPDTFRGQSTLWPFRAIALGFKYALRPGASWGVEAVHETVQWLRSQPDVDPNRIVVAGFCYGGGSAVRYAVAHPGSVAGVVIFYGRPILEAREVANLGNTPLLAMYGTRDSQFPADMLETFRSQLSAAGVPFRIEMFPGKGHAFVKDLEAVRSGGAAGRAWGLFREFIREATARK